MLHRHSGSAIPARTLDLGPGGMRASTHRPLALDEVVTFDLVLDGDVHITGQARVMRHEGGAGYALRFEGLREPSLRQLKAVRASPSSR